jgi:hypothetical protein
MGDMQGLRWMADNWVTMLNAVGVVGGLFFTAAALHSQTETQRVANLLTITANHREIWKEFFRRPELARVLESSVDLTIESIAPEERIFVNMVTLHTSSVFESLKNELVTKQEGLRCDVWWFFSLPIPQAVWEKTKLLQNDDFVEFVESCRNWK